MAPTSRWRMSRAGRDSGWASAARSRPPFRGGPLLRRRSTRAGRRDRPSHLSGYGALLAVHLGRPESAGGAGPGVRGAQPDAHPGILHGALSPKRGNAATATRVPVLGSHDLPDWSHGRRARRGTGHAARLSARRSVAAQSQRWTRLPAMRPSRPKMTTISHQVVVRFGRLSFPGSRGPSCFCMPLPPMSKTASRRLLLRPP
jgi:hypothetical protein